jgi:transcriptional regulator with XRE-family HTH domain
VMTNKEKFLALISKEESSTLEKNRERIKNRAMLRESQQIAIKVMKKLDELEWSQKDLAVAMNVSPQQVNKIVKGQENLTLETQIKLQTVLDIPILASYHEVKWDSVRESVFAMEKVVQNIEQPADNSPSRCQPFAKVFKLEPNEYSDEYSYSEVG